MVLTPVVAVALLLPVFGSVVVALMEAVAVNVPLDAGFTLATTVIVTGDADTLKPPVKLQLTVPVAPTAGGVQLTPAGAVSEANVVLAFSGKLNATPVALLGPALVAVIV